MADDPTQLASDLRRRITDAVADAALDTGLSEDDQELIVARRDGLVDTILAAIDDEAIDRMAQHYVDDTHVRALEFRNGAEMSLKPAQDMVAMWVAAARTMLGDAENYTETEVGLPSATWSMDVKLAGEFEMFTLTVQRARKPTPHELRRQAETERDQARAELAEMRARIGEGADELNRRKQGGIHFMANDYTYQAGYSRGMRDAYRAAAAIVGEWRDEDTTEADA